MIDTRLIDELERRCSSIFKRLVEIEENEWNRIKHDCDPTIWQGKANFIDMRLPELIGWCASLKKECEKLNYEHIELMEKYQKLFEWKNSKGDDK